MLIAQISTGSDAVTWVGVLSGGIPVAAVGIVVSWVLWKAWAAERLRNTELTERLLAERTDLVPLLKDTSNVLMRATVLLERQVSSNQAGGR